MPLNFVQEIYAVCRPHLHAGWDTALSLIPVMRRMAAAPSLSTALEPGDGGGWLALLDDSVGYSTEWCDVEGVCVVALRVGGDPSDPSESTPMLQLGRVGVRMARSIAAIPLLDEGYGGGPGGSATGGVWELRGSYPSHQQGYRLRENFARGGFGEVWRAVRRPGESLDQEGSGNASRQP